MADKCTLGAILKNPFSDGYPVHPGEQEGPRKLATASKLGHRRIFGVRLGWLLVRAYLGAAEDEGCAGATLGASAPDCASSMPRLYLRPNQMAPITVPIRIRSPKSPTR
jgi:hypothetical protein